tara:strand:+ start:39 stop:230 length:192 start_codon:yes stop_codon:yes gene_type:complete
LTSIPINPILYLESENINMKETITIKGIKVDVRAKDCMYITIGNWVIYIDNSTGEQIINSWKK